MLLGADGCKGGWVLIVEHDDGSRETVKVGSISDIIGLPALDLAIIDIPIGLFDSEARNADREVRRFLGTRGCCVFPAPYRSVVAATTYAEACAWRQRIDGKRMSQQAFGIISKIREVDLAVTPELQARIQEGHPEVKFAVLNSGKALDSPKKTRSGFEERRSVLEAHFPELKFAMRHARPAGVARDDLLDAYAMLWTARRVKQGIHVRFPRVPQTDPRGLRAEILA